MKRTIYALLTIAILVTLSACGGSSDTNGITDDPIIDVPDPDPSPEPSTVPDPDPAPEPSNAPDPSPTPMRTSTPTPSPEPTPIASPRTIEVTLVKGLVNDALCRLYAVDLSGDELASANTTNGFARFNNVNFDGTVLIGCEGGVYTDEATGATLTAPLMRSVREVSSDTMIEITIR